MKKFSNRGRDILLALIDGPRTEREINVRLREVFENHTTFERHSGGANARAARVLPNLIELGLVTDDLDAAGYYKLTHAGELVAREVQLIAYERHRANRERRRVLQLENEIKSYGKTPPPPLRS